jgi:hypothetical protein
MIWRSRLAALLLVVGVVLSPLRAVAATIPTLMTYDASILPTATIRVEAGSSVRPERGGVREYGDVSLRFEKNGALAYTVHLAKKEQIMRLAYRVDGTTLVTDQPSSPREERTEFFFTPDGRLAPKNPPPAPPTFYVRK